MKKFTKIIFFLFITIPFIACKKETKKDIKQTEVIVKKSFPFVLKNANNSINFTAYKTTEKIPVKGTFTKIEILKGGKGTSVKEAINGTEFKIPVSSIETKDDSRNLKIRQFFFGVMENSLDLTGKLNLNDDKTGELALTMNGVTEKLPIKYDITGKTFLMKGVLNVENWKATKALESLNKACFELHKGKDGVSKTWSEVAINATVSF